MAIQYRITYQDDDSNDIDIDLWCGNDGVRVAWETELNRNIGSTGIYETVVQRTLRMVEIDVVFYQEQYRKLVTFMSFAQQGKAFSFTKDVSKETSMPISAAVSVGDTLIPFGAAHTFVAGDEVYISDEYRTTWDLGIVDSIAANSITLLDPVTHAYSNVTPDNVYWDGYYPSLLLLDTKFDPDRDGQTYTHTFNCVEVIYGS